MMTQNYLLLIGLVFIFLGILIVLFSSITRGRVESGGMVLIGPIPIVWGISKQMLLIAALLGIILLLISILMFKSWLL